MRSTLMTYNLFEGAHQSYSQLVNFIKASNIDILCLQEVNEWQENDFAKLKDFALECGFSHYVFGNSNTRFKLATLSRYPILSHQVYTEGFWHSLIEIRISIDTDELTVFNLHLNPQWEDPRREEVKKLLDLINVNIPTLLVGDFNSLSKRDNYTASLLDELQAHGITKFGRDELEFSVTDMLESVGLVDIAAKLKNITTTVPSTFNKDKNHEVPLRLDYIFASQSATSNVESIEIIKNSITDSISDHYPILVTLMDHIDISGKTSSLDDGPFYHGTKADLQVGDLLTAGFKSNYRPEVTMNHIYFTALANGAGLAAELASGSGRARVYIVEPTGFFENDPNVTDKKFPGNPTRSYRSQEPLKIVGEVTDWIRLTPEQLQEWRSKLSNIKGEIVN